MSDGVSIHRLDLSQLNVIVVEDNIHMRQIVRTMLNGYGFRNVLEAEDGISALELLESSAPDLIITDWMMPHMDGLELTRMLRNPRMPNPYIPIIMMTSHSEKRRVLQARDSGITEFLCKPISAKSLYLRIANTVVNPRYFIKSKTFFGPDRRRFENPLFKGDEKRQEEHGVIGLKEIEKTRASNRT